MRINGFLFLLVAFSVQNNLRGYAQAAAAPQSTGELIVFLNMLESFCCLPFWSILIVLKTTE